MGGALGVGCGAGGVRAVVGRAAAGRLRPHTLLPGGEVRAGREHILGQRPHVDAHERSERVGRGGEVLRLQQQ